MIYGDLVFEKDESLTRAAKEIFGEDLVLNAYVSAYNSTYDPAYTTEQLKDEHNEFLYNIEDGRDIDAREIAIEFVSGKLVQIGSSQWGSIINITDKWM